MVSCCGFHCVGAIFFNWLYLRFPPTDDDHAAGPTGDDDDDEEDDDDEDDDEDVSDGEEEVGLSYLMKEGIQVSTASRHTHFWVVLRNLAIDSLCCRNQHILINLTMLVCWSEQNKCTSLEHICFLWSTKDCPAVPPSKQSSKQNCEWCVRKRNSTFSNTQTEVIFCFCLQDEEDDDDYVEEEEDEDGGMYSKAIYTYVWILMWIQRLA